MSQRPQKTKEVVLQPPSVTWSSPKDITSIIQKYKEGSNKEYDIFVSNLTNPLLQDSALLAAAKGLKDCVMMLGRDMEVLVGVILKVDWTSRDPAVIRELQAFIINLVSAHPFYLRACLRMILRQFAPRVDPSPASGDLAEVDSATRQKHDEAFSHLHCLLRAILQLVPMSPTVLLPMLAECFPYMTKDPYVIEAYAKNLLIVTQYLPTERIRILEIIVDVMLKLDVRAPRNDILEAEGENSDDDALSDDGLPDCGTEQSMFDMDDDKLLGASSSSKVPRAMSHGEALRLDCLMSLVLQYVRDVCHDEGGINWEATKKLYRDLMVVFERLVLPTHESCHVQFVWFYMCSLRQALVDDFVDDLWRRVQNPNVQVIFRQSAVAYISSLLARAKYVPMSTVVSMLDLMSAWARRYVSQSEHSSEPDVQRHGCFYAVCQALFYIFAFRHRQLLSLHNGVRYCQNLGLQSLVTCHLNPLQVCSPVVGKTFSSIARSHQVAFCDTVLERNRRLQCFYPSDARSASDQRCIRQLESFFPFDPYLLRRSAHYISALYQEFEGLPVEEEEDAGANDGEHHDDMMEIVGSLEANCRLLTSPEDFVLYGTSPGFKTTASSAH